MSEPLKTLTVEPLQNALDSLRRVARELEAFQAGDALALKGVLAWGWHAVAVLAYARLLPKRESFDRWVQEFFQAGVPQLQVERDAHWEEGNHINLLEWLDLLSAPELPSLKPEFYHGWQDRASRCQDLRRQVALAIGGAVGAEQRSQLLLLLAAYNRLLRLPAQTALDTARVQRALPAWLQLLELLVDRAWPQAAQLNDAITACRAAAHVR
jgi:hypothetical protein